MSYIGCDESTSPRFFPSSKDRELHKRFVGIEGSNAPRRVKMARMRQTLREYETVKAELEALLAEAKKEQAKQ